MACLVEKRIKRKWHLGRQKKVYALVYSPHICAT